MAILGLLLFVPASVSAPTFKAFWYRPSLRLTVVNPSSRYYRIRRRLSNEKRRRKVRRSWINFLVLGFVRLSFSIVASRSKCAFEALFFRGSVPLPGSVMDTRLGPFLLCFSGVKGLLRTLKMIQLKLLSTVR